MGKIFRVNGYLVDVNGDNSTEDIEAMLSYIEDVFSQCVQVEEADFGNPGDDEAILYDNCKPSDCAKYFKQTDLRMKDQLIEIGKRIEELEEENRVLRKYNMNGSSGICRAKILGDRYGRWHIGNIISSDKHCYMLQEIEDEGAAKDKFGNSIIWKFTFAEVEPDTVQRFACAEDMTGEKLFEGDVIQNPEHETVRMEICYGKYAAFCPNDQEYMENVGFFLVPSTTGDALPLGATNRYARLLGNVIDRPDLKVV